MKKKRKSGFSVGRLASLAGFPETTLSDKPTLECCADSEIIVDGCSGILEYSEQVIRLSAKDMSIRFSGEKLFIGAMEKRGLVIRGKIRSVEFLR